MVGDRHVFVAARLGRFGHLLDGVAPVGFDRVHVHVALQILLGDQARQCMFLSGVNLAQIFA